MPFIEPLTCRLADFASECRTAQRGFCRETVLHIRLLDRFPAEECQNDLSNCRSEFT